MDHSKVKCVQNFDCAYECDVVDFHPSTPYAEHMLGSWERQMRTVKRVFSGILDQQSCQLTAESLSTMLVEVEAIVNTRPLSVENSPDPFLKPLSPSQLLTTKLEHVLPPPGEFSREDMYLHRQWRRCRFVVNQFWLQWRKTCKNCKYGSDGCIPTETFRSMALFFL